MEVLDEKNVFFNQILKKNRESNRSFLHFRPFSLLSNLFLVK